MVTNGWWWLMMVNDSLKWLVIEIMVSNDKSWLMVNNSE